MTIKTRKTKIKTEGVSDKPRSRARKSKVERVELDSKLISEDLSLQKNTQFALEGLDRSITGRAVFAVRTLGNVVSVESAFIEEGGNILSLPAIFPNRQYAIEQIDELRQIVNQHFDDLEKNTDIAK